MVRAELQLVAGGGPRAKLRSAETIGIVKTGNPRAEAELAAFREEIARDLDAAVLVAKEAKPRTKVKPGAMRV